MRRLEDLKKAGVQGKHETKPKKEHKSEHKEAPKVHSKTDVFSTVSIAAITALGVQVAQNMYKSKQEKTHLEEVKELLEEKI